MGWSQAKKEVRELLWSNAAVGRGLFGNDVDFNDSDEMKNYLSQLDQNRAGYEMMDQALLAQLFFIARDMEESIESPEQSQFQWSEIGRSFGDIVRDGPENIVEYNLIAVAQAVLNPQDFNECITKNVSVEQVISKIQESEVLRLIETEIERERTMGIDKGQIMDSPDQEVDLVPYPEDGLESLGEEFGILEMIAELLSRPIMDIGIISSHAKGNDIAPPSTPDMDVEGKSKGQNRNL